MTRVRCPQERCIFWLDGWCDSDEIELDPSTLSCITFEEIDENRGDLVASDHEDDELEWEDDESIFEDELDERLYGYEEDDEEDDDEEEELVADDEESWPI